MNSNIRPIFLILALNIIQSHAADFPSPSFGFDLLANCDKTKANANSALGIYFDKIAKQCKVKIGTPIKISSKNEADSIALKNCPANADIHVIHTTVSDHIKKQFVTQLFLWTYFGSFTDPTAVCLCAKSYTPSTDLKNCVPGKSRSESCTNTSNPRAGIPLDNCNSFAGLSCQSGKCLCKFPNSIWKDSYCYSDADCTARSLGGGGSGYDPNLQTCIHSVHQVCKPANSSPEPDPLFGIIPPGICLPGAECKTGNAFDFGLESVFPTPEIASNLRISMCDCAPGLKKTSSGGRCKKQITYGDPCTSTEMCSDDSDIDGVWRQHLTCNNATCGCSGGSFWDRSEGEGQCVLPALANCRYDSSYYSREKNCARNSKCQRENYENNEFKCKCQEGYEKRSGRFCKGNYLSKCLLNEDCDDGQGLSCTEARCQCTNPLKESFSEQEKKCLRKVGADCSEKCVQGAACKNGICQCQSGFSKTPEGFCMKSYQNSCISNECNHFQGLICKGQACACYDPSLEFVIGKGCLAPLGEVCGNVKVESCERKTEEGKCVLYAIGCLSPGACSPVLGAVQFSRCQKGNTI